LTNNQFIIKLLDKNEDLIKICNYHGIFNNIVDDVLQETYVKLLNFKEINRYVKDDEPNMFIVFKIISNVIHDYRKVEKKYIDEINIWSDDNGEHSQEIDRYLIYLQRKYGYVYSSSEEDNEKYEFIKNELEHISDWFKKRLLELYINDEHTIRSLSKATKINTNVIQKVFREFKLDCVEKYKIKKTDS